jgi:hypothetical protein
MGPVTVADLVAEGERLSKRSLLLVDEPRGPVVAVWGGAGPEDRDSSREDTHWISVDGAWLAANRLPVKGVLSLYEVDRKYGWPVPYDVDELPGTLSSIRVRDGAPLYGREMQSFPPIMALCLYGGDVVARWLAAEGLDRIDYQAAQGRKLGAAYEEEWMRRCPLYTGGSAAVLGGWHMMWPEDDFYMPREMSLLLWTFRDAEPWLELWRRGPNFRVEERIT